MLIALPNRIFQHNLQTYSAATRSWVLQGVKQKANQWYRVIYILTMMVFLYMIMKGSPLRE